MSVSSLTHISLRKVSMYGRYGRYRRRGGPRRRSRRTYRRSTYRRSYKRTSYRRSGGLRRLSRGLRAGTQKSVERGEKKLNAYIERAEKMRNYFAKQVLVGASKYGRFADYLQKGGIDPNAQTPFGQYKNSFGNYKDGGSITPSTPGAAPASGNSGNAGGLAASSTAGTAGVRGGTSNWTGISSLTGTSNSSDKRRRLNPFGLSAASNSDLLTIESDFDDVD